MSETKSVHDWAKDWQALQQQYWTAWADLTRNQAAGAPAEAPTPWHEGLEQWARMFGAAGRQSEAAERLMSSAKSYLSLMQSMLSFAAGRDAAALDVPSWLEAMRNGMNMPQFDASALGAFDPAAFGKLPGFDASSLLNNPVAKALREISGQGVKGFEQLASGALPLLQQFQQEGMSWLRAPAFGYAREHQEHYQKMALAFAEFQKALNRYNALMLKSSQRSFEILELKVAEHSEPGRQIESVRALYDMWVDAAEEAYAEIALSDEFRKVYAEVVNSQMRVRSQLQQEVERIGVDLGMPTRTELNSVHKRLHDLRRELRATQEALQEASSDGRDGEIAAMRLEIEELRRLIENSGPPAAPAKRSPRKRGSSGKTRSAARTKRARPKAKRVAKRSHVPARTAKVETSMPASPSQARAKPAQVAASAAPAKPARAKPVPAKPAHANKKRHPKRGARAQTAAKARQPESVAQPMSFGDAIAAVRRELGASGRRKASAARVAWPSRASAPLSGWHRRNPR